MSKFTKVSLYILSAILLFSACKKDTYYDRPSGLAQPIYQELQKRGNFTNLLSLIDKAGYKDILGKTGSWTFFAANDAAYKTYFTANNTSLDKIDADGARKLVLYNLVYNPFRKDQLTSTQLGTATIPNTSFKRQTAYYDFVYTEASTGKKIFNNGNFGPIYIPTVNNNKWMPYFITSFLDFNLLNGTAGAPDYATLYPGITFSGFNVADAKVVTADIPAENGLIHEVDKVIPPLPNFDQYIASKPEYSEFKKLLDKEAQYTQDPTLSLRYKTLTGSTDQVYIKSYSGIAFAPNNESTSGSLPPQANDFSMVIPTNQQLKAYTDDVLQFYGGSFDAAPASILSTFLNSHMWITTLWPTHLTQDVNTMREPATFTASNVVDTKVLSNGILYGINTVQQPNAFRTVFGKSFLNPAYTILTQDITNTDLGFSLQTPATASGQFKVTEFMLSNATLNANGYDYDPNRPAFTYTPLGGVLDASTAAKTRIDRVIQTSVVKTPFNEFDNLAGEGVGEAYNGEYVKFKAGKVQASGNVVDNTFVTVTGPPTAAYNGKVYFSPNTTILKFAEDAVTPALSISALATSTDATINTKFSHFWNYLKNTAIYNSTTGDISTVDKGSFYTVFIPTNVAIETAVKAGLLPGNTTTGVPNFVATTWTIAQNQAVINFIYYSFLSKVTVAVDGKKADVYQTLLKTPTGEARKLTVSFGSSTPATWNSAIPLTLTDDAATPSSTTTNFSFSNNLANRTLIHSINNVLKF